MPVLQINYLINAAKEISQHSLEALSLAEKVIASRDNGFKGLSVNEQQFQALKKEIEIQMVEHLVETVENSSTYNQWIKNHKLMKSTLFKYDLKLSNRQNKNLYFSQAKLYAQEAILNSSNETFNEIKVRLESLCNILIKSKIISENDFRVLNNPNLEQVGLDKEKLESLIKKAKENSFKKIEEEYLPKFNSSLRKQTVINSLINRLSDSDLSIKYWLANSKASIENKNIVKQYSA
jgi:hypothetical protein